MEIVPNTIRGHARTIHSIVITSNGFKIISGSYDKSVKVWSLHNGECLNTCNQHADTVWSVAITIDETKISLGLSIKVLKYRIYKLVNASELYKDIAMMYIL